MTTILFLAVPSMSPARGSVRPESAPDAAGTPARPGNLPPDSRLEQLIREVYLTHETTIARSGHDLRFRLRQFETILRHEFDEHEALEVMPPDVASRIVQVANYYEAPWVRVGKVVYYDLRWEPTPANHREVAARRREILADASIARTFQLERELGLSNRKADPLGITTFLVDVEFAGRAQTYRAAAFWQVSDQDPDRFTMELVDEVVPRVGSTVIEEALPLPADEFERIQHPSVRR